MSSSKKLASAVRTKAFARLIESGLKMTSTERQIKNGSIKLVGKFGRGRKAITSSIVITANGAVISNEFVARRVLSYNEGLVATAELLSKRGVKLAA